MTRSKSRIFSGIQPTNVLHIGNYIGAIEQWVQLQKQHECFFCIVDLHALTVKQNSKVLQENIRKTAAFYLACGIDPKKSIVFVQSHISAHAELGWILNTMTKMSELERMTQYKDKAAQHSENVNIGLFDYPVLMAADILLYDTDCVPVGEDQSQHVELARTLAKRFNSLYGQVLHVPKLQLRKEGARIMALDNTSKKMSKSASSSMNYIALDDAPEIISQKIKKSVTDSQKGIVFDPKRQGLFNLLMLYKIFSGLKPDEIEKKFEGANYGELKSSLSSVMVEFLTPIQERYKKYMHDKRFVEDVLADGFKRAQPIAEHNLQKVYKAIGIR